MTHYVKITGTKFNDVLVGSGLNEKILGKKGDDIISGADGADKLKGGAGDDVITGGHGNDDIDGGNGTDVAVYSGSIEQYSLSFGNNGNLKGTVTDLIASRDGTDTLKNVEFLQFANAIYDVANDTVFLLNRPPVLAPVPGVTYNDTPADDTFAAWNGTLSASDPDNDALVFAIAGASADHSLPGFDLSKSSAYGALFLNSTTGAYRFMPNDTAIEGLVAPASVGFTFTVSDGSLSDSRTFTVTLNGVNDTPVVSGAVMGSATEDGAASALDALANASDRDIGQTLSVVNIPALPAGVSYNAATHSFTLDPSNAAYQHLAQDAHTAVIVAYAVSDGIATTPASVSWTVTGVNDPPVAHDKSDSAPEGGPVISGSVTATDPDDGASLTYAAVGTIPSGLTFNSNGSYSFDPTVAAYDHLAKDETQNVVLSYQVSDGLGGTSAAALTITVTGTNDPPSLAMPMPTGESLDNNGLNLTAVAAFTDADLNDAHTVTFTEPGSGYVGDFTANIAAGNDSTGSGAGTVSLTYHLTKDQYDAVGGQIPDHQDYLVTIDDHNGGTSSETVSIPLAQILSDLTGGGGGGNNSPPAFAGGNFSGQVLDNPHVSGTVFASGTIFFTDPDPGQDFTISIGSATMASHILFSPNQPPQQLPGPIVIGDWNATFIQMPNGNTPGEIHWNYTVPEAAIRPMTSGEHMFASFPLTISDGEGGQVTQNIQIDLAGTDEPPFVLGANSVLNAGADISQYLLPTDQLTRVQTLPSVSIYEDPLTTGDSTTHHTVSGTVAFIDPDTLDTMDAVTLVPADLTHTNANDADYNALVTPLMNGFSYSVERHGNFGTITWSYDIPDSALDFLAAGTTMTVSAKLSVGEISGGAFSVINIDLHGADDAPVITGSTADSFNVSAAGGTASGTLNFSDPDWYPDGHNVQFVFHDPNNHGSVIGGTNVEDGRGDGGTIGWSYTAGPGTLSPGDDSFDIVLTDNSGVSVTHTVHILLV